MRGPVGNRALVKSENECTGWCSIYVTGAAVVTARLALLLPARGEGGGERRAGGRGNVWGGSGRVVEAGMAAGLACGVSVIGAVLCLCEHATRHVSWTALWNPPQKLICRLSVASSAMRGNGAWTYGTTKTGYHATRNLEVLCVAYAINCPSTLRAIFAAYGCVTMGQNSGLPCLHDVGQKAHSPSRCGLRAHVESGGTWCNTMWGKVLR